MDLSEIDSIVLNSGHLERVVVLTGAGISSESGVPTFRGEGGLWRHYRPEELATPQAFAADPQLVWEWYLFRRQIIASAEPNPGHTALVDLEDLLRDHLTLITQNVDGLHRRAGSRNPLELHGNIFVNRCNNCSHHFPDDTLNFDILPPICTDCQGPIRPDVVWFGENLNPVTIEDAFSRSRMATLFLSVGTSAVVHPAASLPVIAKENGAYLIEINPDSTPISPLVDTVIRSASAEALRRLVEKIIQLKTEQN